MSHAPHAQIPLPTEVLDRVMSFLGPVDLWSACRVSTYFHVLAVRSAMVQQLRGGDFSWDSETRCVRKSYPRFT